MCFARNSFTSLWRGTGWGYSGLRVEIPIVFPAVSNEHPASSILRIRSICFIQWSVRPLCEYLESHCSSGPDVDHGGSLEFFHRFPLSQVVRELFKVAQPHIAILPVNVPSRVHTTILLTASGGCLGQTCDWIEANRRSRWSISVWSGLFARLQRLQSRSWREGCWSGHREKPNQSWDGRQSTQTEQASLGGPAFGHIHCECVFEGILKLDPLHRVGSRARARGQ